MASISNLPRVNSMSEIMITSDDLGAAKEAEFIKSIKEDGVRILVADNKIACVMLDVAVYNNMMDVFDKVVKTADAKTAALTDTD